MPDSNDEDSKKVESDGEDSSVAGIKEKRTEVIPSESAEELMQLLAKLSSEQLQQILDAYPQITKTVEMKHFSGPLPTPEAFEKYNEVQPDAADRIIRMAENEQRIRNDAQQGAIRNDKHRINAALFTNILLLGIAGFSIYEGLLEAGIMLGLAGPITAMVRILLKFLEGRSKRDG